MDAVPNNHLYFVIFVLRQYFKIFSYPIEISNIIVMFLKRAGNIFKLTFYVQPKLRKVFELINKISDECYIQITEKNVKIFTPNNTISIIVLLDHDIFEEIYNKYPIFIVSFKTIELIKKINNDNIITIRIENFLSSDIIISDFVSSSKIKSTNIKDSFSSSKIEYDNKVTLDIESLRPIYQDLIGDDKRKHMDFSNNAIHKLMKSYPLKTREIIRDCHQLHHIMELYLKNDLHTLYTNIWTRNNYGVCVRTTALFLNIIPHK